MVTIILMVVEVILTTITLTMVTITLTMVIVQTSFLITISFDLDYPIESIIEDYFKPSITT